MAHTENFPDTFETGVRMHVKQLVCEQYRFLENLEVYIKTNGLITEACYTPEIDQAVQSLGDYISKVGTLTLQPELILGGELLTIISGLTRAVSAAWENSENKKRAHKFLSRIKTMLAIVETVENLREKICNRSQIPISTGHAINVLSQYVAIYFRTRHTKLLSGHKNSVKPGQYGAGRLHRFVKTALSERSEKIINAIADGEDSDAEITLDNSTLAKFLLNCCLPPKDYKHYYHASSRGTINWRKQLGTGSSVHVTLKDVFTHAAIIQRGVRGATIYIPIDCVKFTDYPPIIVNNAASELGTDILTSNYKLAGSSFALSDFGLTQAELDSLPNLISTVEFALQCPIIDSKGMVYKPKLGEAKSLETYPGRLPAIHVDKLPFSLKKNYQIFSNNIRSLKFYFLILRIFLYFYYS